MQGTIVKLAVEDGQKVVAGDQIVVLEAMKMESPVSAHISGVITGLGARTGDPITERGTLCEISG